MRAMFGMACVAVMLAAGPVMGRVVAVSREAKLMSAARDGAEGVLGVLLDDGARINTTDTLGRTALHYAVAGGHEATARMLLDRGADLNAMDTEGHTPLALAYAGGHTQLVAFLQSKGARSDGDVATTRTISPVSRPVYSAQAETMARSLRSQLPPGWTCTVTTEPGRMGHPHGLGEPMFRLDFENRDVKFPAEHGAISKGQLSPCLRLHFHSIDEQREIERVVEAERVYSWDIPTTYAVLRNHIVVSSPGWKNHGYSTPKANAAIAPLLAALQPAMHGSASPRPEDMITTAQKDAAEADRRKLSPGSTRADLLRYFQEEGGLSNARQRTYVHRGCEVLKVDVKFDPTETTQSVVKELPTDRIREISPLRPGWSIQD
ncbi:MAG: ankyrin repeat domain-containing protein [Candidatus Sumerlaeaceae bacterium]|nr:ankyrin repeat domain-containing protein [Candidatus Sumerlaeaceae bacterium]